MHMAWGAIGSDRSRNVPKHKHKHKDKEKRDKDKQSKDKHQKEKSVSVSNKLCAYLSQLYRYQGEMLKKKKRYCPQQVVFRNGLQ